MKNEKEKLRDRMYTWTLELIRALEKIPPTTTNSVIIKQLLRSGTSVCANYIEGQAAASRKDFINFLHISLKSANESKYWISLLKDLGSAEPSRIDQIFNELQEISNILGASLVTLKRNQK